MTKIAAVVPVKALAAAKTRLGGVLAPEARAALALWLLERVVGALRASGVVARLAVVSPDTHALERAATLGAMPLRQESGTLNQGVALGRDWALAEGAEALLVALGDLPRLVPAEVRALVALGEGSAPMRATRTMATRAAKPGSAVLAPDRGEAGTNLLLLRPPDGLPFLFGRASFTRHLALAHARGLAVAIYRSPGTAFDLDWPADLDELRNELRAAGSEPPEALAGLGASAATAGERRLVRDGG